jgi:hypothetical protein
MVHQAQSWHMKMATPPCCLLKRVLFVLDARRMQRKTTHPGSIGPFGFDWSLEMNSTRKEIYLYPDVWQSRTRLSTCRLLALVDPVPMMQKIPDPVPQLCDEPRSYKSAAQNMAHQKEVLWQTKCHCCRLLLAAGLWQINESFSFNGLA